MANVDAKVIGEALAKLYQNCPAETVELGKARIVVFSDQHKGQGDKADDFVTSKPAYHAALGYYLETGYRLFTLGDVEELWECRPGPVLGHYATTLALEMEFHRQGRYVRFWGNHDDEWRHAASVAKYLHPLFGPLQVQEGLRLKVTQGNAELGTLFFAHGHQGTRDSDKYGKVSRFFVRVVWRNVQRLTGWRLNTPATDLKLREAHDVAMYEWAASQSKVILVVGHTHRPVFTSETHAQQIQRKIQTMRAPTPAGSSGASAGELAAERAKLEWVRARSGAGGPVAAKPCYFNTGCCCFDDGDITGLEIDGDELRLVRWPDDEGKARAKILAVASLAETFEMC